MKISDAPEFHHFVDKMTPYTDQILELPYGLVAVIVEAININLNRKNRKEADAEELRKFYFMIGAMLTNKTKNLIFKSKDIDILESISRILGIDMLLQELTLTNSVTAIYKDGEWTYTLTKEQDTKVEEFLDNLASRKT